jgi:restriction system protein
MAKAIMISSSFATALSEDVGERSGLSIDHATLVHHLGDCSVFGDAFVTEERLLRVDLVDYAEVVGDLLFALGTVEKPGMPTLGTRLINSLGRGLAMTMDIDRLLTVEAVADHALRKMQPTGVLDREFLRNEVNELMGAFAKRVLDALEEVMPYHLAFHPAFTRHTHVTTQVELARLFASERLPEAGTFFDQRFVNYLSANPEKLDAIHWRQFEALAAEWLQREGYDVELGPGRNDGGVDVRAWNAPDDRSMPPAIIVQCKRQRGSVGKVVVKALWADVYAEKAASGLIVTTSDLSRGATGVINARAYPVTVANGSQVKKWIAAMRKPAAGVVL